MIDTNVSGAGTLREARAVIIEQHGVRYEIVLPNADQDHIQKQILESAAPYELGMLEDMRRRLAENDLVLDVGANIGNHALYLARVAKVRVVAFEPNEPLCSAIRESIARNGLAGRISVRPHALGSAQGAARFEETIPRNSGAQRLVLGDGDLEVMPLDAITLDGPVRAIKIDVEGMELAVLQGAAALIERDRPLVYVECRDETSFRQMMAWAHSHRYAYWDTFNVTPTHLLIPDESIGVEQRIAQLSFNTAIEEYRSLASARRSRKAQTEGTAAIDRLRLELQTERVARGSAEAELKRVAAELESALTELEQARVRLSELETSRRALQRLLNDQQISLARHAGEVSRMTAAHRAERASIRMDAAGQAWRARRLENELATVRAYGRELEHRYLAVLDSETWQIMEPVRAALRWIRRLPAAPPFAPRLSQGGDLTAKPKPKPKPKKGPRPASTEALGVEDLVAKLWGGFSSYAVGDLERLAKNSDRETADRVTASWNLARWAAASGDWEECLSHMETIAHLDEDFFRSGRSQLLFIEANIRVGNLQRAVEHTKHALRRRRNGNFVCALSNILLHQGGSERSGRERLDAMNDLYRGEGLAPLALIDPAQGFVFGNLKAEDIAPTGLDGPKISVLVPAYNAGAFIETAIESLIAQSWRHLEIIAVDDGSTDDTWHKLCGLAARDERLRIYRNETNLGLFPTRNRALALSTGDVVTVHDADDWSHPQMLEVQADALSSSTDVRGTFSAMARALPNLEFKLRPERHVLEYVHRSYPSLMMRRSDLARLHQWDGVLVNADDELVQRAHALWGSGALRDILPTTPLSFFLRRENSLTEQREYHLRSLTFGIRQEYSKQAEFWRRSVADKLADGVPMERVDCKTPFPIPNGLAPKNWRRDRTYDLVIISDLGLLGGTRRCNEGYVKAATELGLRVGLFHWPRYDLALTEIAPCYRRMSYQPNVDILVPEDEVDADTILIHHPPILRYSIDAVPRISAEQVAILVNQLPTQLRDTPPQYYLPDDVDMLCRELFGSRPLWIPISPLTRRLLEETGDLRLHDEDWFPPLGEQLPADGLPLRPDVGTARRIVLGRHSRDHWTKWPATKADVAAAYCAGTDIDVRLMGGAKMPRRLLNGLPENWRVLPFDQIPVDDFLAEIDIFVHFVHDDYIEEFGRNVVEAMARGIPVLLPKRFEETFGDAAVYCAPEDVEATVRRLWSSPSSYREAAERGYRFALGACDQRIVVRRLAGFVRPKARVTAV